MLTTRAAINDPLFAQDDLKVNVLHENSDINDQKDENCVNVKDAKEKMRVNNKFTSINNSNYTNDTEGNVNASLNSDAAKSKNCIDN